MADREANETLTFVASVYLVAAGWVFLQFSQAIGIALLVNAVGAFIVGLVARGMGKREFPVVCSACCLARWGRCLA